MQIDVTVRCGDRDQDVAVVAPGPVPFRDVAARLAEASAVDAGASWWSGAECVPPGSLLGGAGLRPGAVLTPGGPAPGWSRPGVLTLHQVGGPDSGRVLPLECGRLDIGRGSDCDVVVIDPDASRRHARVEITTGSIRLHDLGSTNGTFLDDRRVNGDGVDLHTGARIRIGDSTFELVGPVETPAACTAAPDGTLRLVRPPRLLPAPADGEIELPAESAATRPRGIQWVTALLPAVAGGAIAWVMHAPQFLLFALLSPVMTLSSSVGDRLHWRRSRRRAAVEFARRRAAAERAVAAGLRDETQARRAAAPDPAAIMRTCALPGSRLWERRATDDDFLRLRTGTGDLPSALVTRTGSVVAPAGTVRAVPVCLDLRAGPAGVAGPADVASGVARWLVCQLAALHSPVDVSITLLLGPAASRRWQWARWLPHLAGRAGDGEHEWPTILAELTAVVEQRLAARARGPGSWGGPWHVVVLDPAQDLAELPGLAGLLARGSAVGVTALCVDENESGLPSACGSVVRINGETGTRAAVRRAGGATDSGVVLDDVSPAWAEAVARSLAPAVDASGHGVGALPDSCRLLDLVGLDECGADDVQRVAQRWAASDDAAETPLGMGPDGPVSLDLVGDGPHALIGGTTGSGKSELLQTLVAGLATRHPPDALSFLLVDYKGGAAFADCARLPHAVGLVTDLDAHLTARALRSLEAELRRRERLFAAVGATDLGTYRMMCDVGPLARLIIVVDEFATLADELPDFVRGLVGVAQRGRSLGIHLVLATQRPAGAVSAEIRANTTTRIALRVTDPGESTDVIDAPDASLIERSRPGRAYLRTGSSLVCFQAAWAGSRPDGGPKIAVTPLAAWRRPTPRPAADTGPTDLARLVDVVTGAARRSGRRPAVAPWVPPLAERIALDSLPPADAPTTVGYAVVDLPDQQRQDVLQLDLARGSSMLAAGAARSGRTGLLTALGLGAAARLSPDELHLYVVDPAGDLAAALGALPHCATVLGPDDLALTPTLLRRLERAAGRASDRPDDQRSRPAPVSVLLVDNWETVCAALPDADMIDCAELLARLQRAAPGARLSTVVTGDRTTLAPRFAAGFDEKLLLRLADRNDYGLAGIASRDAPTTMPPGRALRARDGASLQIALPGTEPGREAAQRHTAEQARTRFPVRCDDLPSAPTGHAPPVRLRALPFRVALTELPRRDGRFTLGVGGETAEPVCIDVFCGAARLLVAGPPRSGRSTVLRAILAQAMCAGTRVVVAAPARSPLRGMAERLGLAVIDPAASADGVGAPPAQPTLLLVDDCESYLDQPAGDALDRWLRDPGAAVAAAVAGRTEDLATSYRGLGAQVRRTNCGLLLRPGPVDGELLGVRLPRRPSSGPPGRGVLVGDPQWGPLFEDGEPIPLQVAIP